MKNNRKMIYVLKWVVSDLRQDKRTGVIGEPAKLDAYNRMLFREAEQMFKDDSKPGDE